MKIGNIGFDVPNSGGSGKEIKSIQTIKANYVLGATRGSEIYTLAKAVKEENSIIIPTVGFGYGQDKMMMQSFIPEFLNDGTQVKIVGYQDYNDTADNTPIDFVVVEYVKAKRKQIIECYLSDGVLTKTENMLAVDWSKTLRVESSRANAFGGGYSHDQSTMGMTVTYPTTTTVCFTRKRAQQTSTYKCSARAQIQYLEF